MDAVLEPFSHAFMQRALGEALLMGLVCGLLGTFVVLRDLAYTGESMSHTLVPGAAVVHVVHTAEAADGVILEISESVWPGERVVILDEYPITADADEPPAPSEV